MLQRISWNPKLHKNFTKARLNHTIYDIVIIAPTKSVTSDYKVIYEVLKNCRNRCHRFPGHYCQRSDESFR